MDSLDTNNPNNDFRQPSKHKMAILTWCAIYPLINIIFYLLGDMFTSLPLLLRTLPSTLILVPLMSYVTLPLLTKYFKNWLMK